MSLLALVSPGTIAFLARAEEHTSELQSLAYLVCRLLLEKKNYKYVVKHIAKKYGKTACFMPKPLSGDNGSGMHQRHSLWKKGEPFFVGQEHAVLSQMALHYA